MTLRRALTCLAAVGVLVGAGLALAAAGSRASGTTCEETCETTGTSTTSATVSDNPGPPAQPNDVSSTESSATFLADGSRPGSLSIDDGKDSVSWPEGAFSGKLTVSLAAVTGSSLPGAAVTTLPGAFDVGGIVFDLTFTAPDGSKVASFAQPLVLHIAGASAATEPAYYDGKVWHGIPKLASPELPPGQADGYFVHGDGSITIFTRHATYFARLRDTTPPSAPVSLFASYASGTLAFTWGAATDTNGAVRAYRLALGPTNLYEGLALTAVVPAVTGDFILTAIDRAGNVSVPATLTVSRKPRPQGLPKAISGWAFRLLAWEQSRRGTRPKTPDPLPGWYSAWRAWRLDPLVIR